MLHLTVYGLPMPAGSKVAGRTKAGRLFVRDANPKAAPWKRQVAQQAGEAMNGHQLADGPLALEVTFFLPRPKAHYRTDGSVKPKAPGFPIVAPDTTKLLRGIEDALQGIVYRNDAQIVQQVAAKVYGEPARAVITVLEWGAGPTPTKAGGVEPSSASEHNAGGR